MTTTDKTYDQAISWTTDRANVPWLVSARGQVLPLIMGGSGDPAAGDPPAGDPPGGDPDPTPGASGDDAGKPKGDDEKKFTQEEVNAIAAREASKAARGKVNPKDYGFDSAKELEEFLKTQKEKLETDKTEDEKAKEQAIKDATTAAESSVLVKANARVIKSEFLLAASEAGIDKAAAGDALLIAQGMDIWEGVEIDDAGVVTGFDDAFFKTLKEQKAYLFKPEGQGGAGDAGAGAGGGQTQLTDDQELREQYSGLPNW